MAVSDAGGDGRRATAPGSNHGSFPNTRHVLQPPIFIRYKGSSLDQREEFIETVYARKEISDVGFFVHFILNFSPTSLFNRCDSKNI